jgi:hypothetical protein
VVDGPGLISRRAVRPARSQSTIEEALVIASRYSQNLLPPAARKLAAGPCRRLEKRS